MSIGLVLSLALVVVLGDVAPAKSIVIVVNKQ
jgi:hypothetical protein